jgi:hypothetical protein
VARDAVEPVADCLAWFDRGSLSNEDEEGGLKCIFGIGRMADDSLTYSPDHGAMTLNQGCKCGLVPLLDKAIQHLAIGQSILLPPQQGLAEVLHDFENGAG